MRGFCIKKSRKKFEERPRDSERRTRAARRKRKLEKRRNTSTTVSYHKKSMSKNCSTITFSLRNHFQTFRIHLDENVKCQIIIFPQIMVHNHYTNLHTSNIQVISNICVKVLCILQNLLSWISVFFLQPNCNSFIIVVKCNWLR